MEKEDQVRKERVVEARAKNISHNVRCTECGSQSIEDSQADVAILLRKVPVLCVNVMLLLLVPSNILLRWANGDLFSGTHLSCRKLQLVYYSLLMLMVTCLWKEDELSK